MFLTIIQPNFYTTYYICILIQLVIVFGLKSEAFFYAQNLIIYTIHKKYNSPNKGAIVPVIVKHIEKEGLRTPPNRGAIVL